MARDARNRDYSFDLLGGLETNLAGKDISVIEFAESPDYCGISSLYPRQKLLLKLIFLEKLSAFEETLLDEWIESKEVTIDPNIRTRIAWCRDNGYKHFKEVVLVGGRRSSKGFVTGIAMAFKMFQMMKLDDPNAFYGIDRNKEIYFTCIAASEKQAKELQYADFSSRVNGCKSMEPNIHKLQELEFSILTEADKKRLREWKASNRKIARDISKLRGRAVPANARTVRGYTTSCATIDEAAHFMQGDSNQSDEEVYEALVPSFAQFGVASLLFVNSSPYSKVGKFYERWQASQEMDGDIAAYPTIFGMQFPSWALYQDFERTKTYKGLRKHITCSPDWDPERKTRDGSYFYSEEDRAAILDERGRERQNPEKFKVERRGIFAEVIDSYLNPDMIDRMFAGRPLADGRGYEPLRTNFRDSSYKHKYVAHIDPSSTTAGFGFALAHIEDIEVQGVTGPHVIFDFVKRWHSSQFPSGVIIWEEILPEIFDVINLFRPTQLTMDSHQTKMPQEWLRRKCRERGISEVRIYEQSTTAQQNWNRYEVFKTALYQGVVHAPNDTSDAELCSQEFKFLQEINASQVPRVDKQDVGPVQTKDMADAVVACVEALIGDIVTAENRQMLAGEPLHLGAQRGYQLGKNTSSPFEDFYTQRSGEQGFGGRSRRGEQGGKNPARRSWGGAPVRRRLPGW